QIDLGLGRVALQYKVISLDQKRLPAQVGLKQPVRNLNSWNARAQLPLDVNVRERRSENGCQQPLEIAGVGSPAGIVKELRAQHCGLRARTRRPGCMNDGFDLPGSPVLPKIEPERDLHAVRSRLLALGDLTRDRIPRTPLGELLVPVRNLGRRDRAVQQDLENSVEPLIVTRSYGYSHGR